MAMKNILLCASLIGLGCSPPSTTAKPTSKSGVNWGAVIVWNKEFKVISTINSSDDLSALSEIWGTRKKSSSQDAPNFQYKIDIRSGPYSGRWLYDSSGFIQRLNIFRKPIFRIEQNKEFNRHLGIKD
jgi:hypothetical protein